MKHKKVRIKVRLFEEENEKPKYCAAECGLFESSFLRQLYIGQTPNPQPEKEFWELLNTLYSVHNGFQEYTKYEPSAMEICKEIECPIFGLKLSCSNWYTNLLRKL